MQVRGGGGKLRRKFPSRIGMNTLFPRVGRVEDMWENTGKQFLVMYL